MNRCTQDANGWGDKGPSRTIHATGTTYRRQPKPEPEPDGGAWADETERDEP